MISENAFTEKDKLELAKIPLKSEMAVPNEWIVRESANPDELLTVQVWPNARGELIAACTCLPNARDLACPHALDVFNQIRANEEILVQLLKRDHHSTAAGHDYLKNAGPFI